MSAAVFPVCWREDSYPGSPFLLTAPRLWIKLELLKQLFSKRRNPDGPIGEGRSRWLRNEQRRRVAGARFPTWRIVSFKASKTPPVHTLTSAAESLNGIWWQIKSLYVTQQRAVLPNLVRNCI